MTWDKQEIIKSRRFRCGFCGSNVASDRGYADKIIGQSLPRGTLYICPDCKQPSYFDYQGKQTPGVTPGNDVGHVPAELQTLYQEARNCCSIGAFTSAVLACRKMLMNIGVNQGAKPGESFVSYVEFLATNGYVPPNGRGWVDHIRKKGNEATHEIALMKREDAEELISFSEMLLKFIYEFPARVPSAPAPAPAP